MNTENIQPLTADTPAKGLVPSDTAVTLTHREIVDAFRAWEEEFRAGKCLSNEAVASMPVGEAASQSAYAFLKFAAACAASTIDDEL